MRRSRIVCARPLGAALGLLLAASNAVFGQRATVGAGASFEHYSFATAAAAGLEALSLMTLPFGGRVALLRTLSLEVTGAYASGTLSRPDGSQAKLSGLTDTDVRAVLSVAQDRFLIAATWSAPTGSATQSLEEAEVAGAIAADLLPFRISNWGSGGGVALEGTALTTVNGTGVGLSLGYGLGREFEPLAEDQRAYLPGNRFQARLALDRSIGESGKATLQLGLQRYGNDQLSGQNLYRSGNRLQAMLSYAFAATARASAVLYGGWLRRQRGTFLDPSLFGSGSDSPAQDLILTGSALRLPAGSGALLPGVDARVFRSADGQGQGYALGVGLGAEAHARNLTLLPTLRARFGKVIATEGVESAFTGIEASATVRFGGTQ